MQLLIRQPDILIAFTICLFNKMRSIIFHNVEKIIGRLTNRTKCAYLLIILLLCIVNVHGQYSSERTSANRLHHLMNHAEKHLLLGQTRHASNEGSSNIDTVPEYELIHAQHIQGLHSIRQKRSLRSNVMPSSVTIRFRAFNQSFDLRLKKNRAFLSPDFQVREENALNEKTSFTPDEDCFFYGYSTFHENSTAAISLCEGIRGLIETEEHTYVINPLTERLVQRSNITHEQPHLVLKQTDLHDYHCPHKHQKHIRSDMASLVQHALHTLKQEHVRHENLTVRSRRSVRDLQLEDELDLLPRPAVVEIAIFLDEELYRLLCDTFSQQSEQQIVTYVLTIMNAVQILFRQRALAAQLHISVVLMDILKSQPKDLIPSDNIDTYLTNFCVWQHNRRLQPVGHMPKWDHALLLSGINMYVVDSSGHKKRHVVGLAPVSGMCNSLNSCTISEGTSFQTVLVAGHEMGHSLGMEHDGPADLNDCDPNSHIMSPSLGAGKSSFSRCSSRYLRSFLRTKQASCLFERNAPVLNSAINSANALVSNEENAPDTPDLLTTWSGRHRLPGEMYGLREQCVLRFGRFASPVKAMKELEICTMVKCEVRLGDKIHIYNAHPALEGSKCARNKWCREGDCVMMDNIDQYLLNNSLDDVHQIVASSTQFKKRADTSVASINEFPLPPKPVKPVATEINEPKFTQVYQNWPGVAALRYKSLHKDGKNRTNDFFSTSFGGSSISVPKDMAEPITVTWSSWSPWNQCSSECMAEAGSKPVGMQVSRRSCVSHTLHCPPDQLRLKLCNAKQLCYGAIKRLLSIQKYIDGICRVAARSDSVLIDKGTQYPSQDTNNPCIVWCQKKTGGYLTQGWPLPNGSSCSINGQNKFCYNGECRNFDCSGNSELNSKACSYATVGFTLVQDNFALLQIPEETQVWLPISNCRHSCLAESKGVRLVSRECTSNFCGTQKRESFQLCSSADEHCSPQSLTSISEYASNICRKYSAQYPSLLSGYGKQLMPRKDNLHASCVVACEDRVFPTAHYQMDSVNDGQFPLGTNCALGLLYGARAYCINGKCVQFDAQDTPIDDGYNDIDYMKRAFVRESMYKNRHRRSVHNNSIRAKVQVITDIRSSEAAWRLRHMNRNPSTRDMPSNINFPNAINGTVMSNLTVGNGQVLRVHAQPSSIILGRWHVEEWQNCSTSCGKGKQIRHVICITPSSDSSVMYLQDDSYCNLAQKPIEIRNCESFDCL